MSMLTVLEMLIKLFACTHLFDYIFVKRLQQILSTNVIFWTVCYSFMFAVCCVYTSSYLPKRSETKVYCL